MSVKAERMPKPEIVMPEVIQPPSQTNMRNAVENLSALFNAVMSGDYNEKQIRSATTTSNAIVKVLRFEFDVYKYFDGKIQARRQNDLPKPKVD